MEDVVELTAKEIILFGLETSQFKANWYRKTQDKKCIGIVDSSVQMARMTGENRGQEMHRFYYRFKYGICRSN